MKRVLLFCIAILILSCTTSADAVDVDVENPDNEVDTADMKDLVNLLNDNIEGSIIIVRGILQFDDAGTPAVIQNPESKSRVVYAVMNPDDFDLTAYQGMEIIVEAEFLGESSPFSKRVKVLSIK